MELEEYLKTHSIEEVDPSKLMAKDSHINFELTAIKMGDMPQSGSIRNKLYVHVQGPDWADAWPWCFIDKLLIFEKVPQLLKLIHIK